MEFENPSELVRFRESDLGLVMSKHAFQRFVETVQSWSPGQDELVETGSMRLENNGSSFLLCSVKARVFGQVESVRQLECHIVGPCSIFLNSDVTWLPADPELETFEYRAIKLSLSTDPSDKSIEIARVHRLGDQLAIDTQYVSPGCSTSTHFNGRIIAQHLQQLTSNRLPAASLLLTDCFEPWRRVLPAIQMSAALLRITALDRAIQEALKADPCYQPAFVLRALRQHLPGLLPDSFTVDTRPSGQLRLELARSIFAGDPTPKHDGFHWVVDGVVNSGEWLVAQVNDLGLEQRTNCIFTSASGPSFSTLEEGKPSIISRGNGANHGEILLKYVGELAPILQCGVYRPVLNAQVSNRDTKFTYSQVVEPC